MSNCLVNEEKAMIFYIQNFCKCWTALEYILEHVEYTLILVNIQCLQYVFYSLLLLQKHRASKQTPDLKILPRRDHAPRL